MGEHLANMCQLPRQRLPCYLLVSYTLNENKSNAPFRPFLDVLLAAYTFFGPHDLCSLKLQQKKGVDKPVPICLLQMLAFMC